MGMYDNIIIDKELLPITSAERALIGPEPGWQTKDIRDDPDMDTYFLSENGILKKAFCFPEQPKTEKVPFRFTGDIRFYTHIGSIHDPECIFMEFLAVYDNSRLISIERA